jgi:hypothetical protein
MLWFLSPYPVYKFDRRNMYRKVENKLWVEEGAISFDGEKALSSFNTLWWYWFSKSKPAADKASTP